MSKLTAQEIAERCAQFMWENDSASKNLGIVIERIAPGEAVLSLQVEKHHLNGHDICHGGCIFTLADSAFAFACNSYNQIAVAQQNSISYTQSGKLGTKLTAHAKEVTRQGRSGVYDVTVIDDKGVTIALFRGNSRTIKGVHFEEEAQQ